MFNEGSRHVKILLPESTHKRFEELAWEFDTPITDQFRKAIDIGIAMIESDSRIVVVGKSHSKQTVEKMTKDKLKK